MGTENSKKLAIGHRTGCTRSKIPIEAACSQMKGSQLSLSTGVRFTFHKQCFFKHLRPRKTSLTQCSNAGAV